MKIAWFSPHFADGGVERTVLLLAQQFMEHGHKADLVSLNINSSMLQNASRDLRVIDLGSSRSIMAIRKLAEYLKKEKPDALISVQHYANVIAILARMLARSNTKLIITERVATTQVLRCDPLIKRIVLGQMMKRTFGFADSVVANSREGASHLANFLGWPEHRVHHIYNPVDIAGIRKMADAENVHPWFDLPDVPVIVSVGRMSEQKDFGTLIDAFSRVVKSRDCRLIILGDGPERGNLEQRIRKHNIQSKVDLNGATENPFAFVGNASIFVLSSLYEGMPNVLIEAQVCGTPVVSTTCETGPTELLLDGDAGKLVPVANPIAMADAIIDVLDNPEDAMAEAEIGTQNLHRFDPVQAYENYVRELAGDH